MKEAVKIRNLSKSYGSKPIFKQFNLDLDEGDMVAITGPSGAGKSTLLNILGILEPFDSGTIYLFGEELPKVNSRKANEFLRNKISYLFQNFALVDDWTVKQNLEIVLNHQKLNKEEKNLKIEEALKIVGLEGYENNKIYTLSGGEQQRVSIARILLKPGELILADEPTGSLDHQNKELVIKLLKQINLLGKTILIVTHDPEVAESCSKNIQIKASSLNADCHLI